MMTQTIEFDDYYINVYPNGFEVWERNRKPDDPPVVEHWESTQSKNGRPTLYKRPLTPNEHQAKYRAKAKIERSGGKFIEQEWVRKNCPGAL